MFGSVVKLAVITLTVASALSARGEPQPQRVAFVGDAVVKQVTGEAQVLDKKEWRSVAAGSAIPAGSELRTKEAGQLILKMVDTESLVKVTPNTVVRLVKADALPKRLQQVAESPAPREAVVRAARGKVELKHGWRWRLVTVGETLPQDSVVRTREGAVADIFFPETRTVVRLEGDSSVRVDPRQLQARGTVLRSVEEQPAIAGLSR